MSESHWEIVETPNDLDFSHDIEGVCGIYRREGSAANAVLIGSAKQMLNALREAEAGLEFAGAGAAPPTDFIPSPTLALRAVRAAIAKATTCSQR